MIQDLELVFFNRLNEKQKRAYAGLRATELGYHGVSQISKQLSIHAHTIRLGQKELISEISVPINQIRAEGGGRKKKLKPLPK
jgi:hypothetical protein